MTARDRPPRARLTTVHVRPCLSQPAAPAPAHGVRPRPLRLPTARRPPLVSRASGGARGAGRLPAAPRAAAGGVFHVKHPLRGGLRAGNQ